MITGITLQSDSKFRIPNATALEQSVRRKFQENTSEGELQVTNPWFLVLTSFRRQKGFTFRTPSLRTELTNGWLERLGVRSDIFLRICRKIHISITDIQCCVTLHSFILARTHHTKPTERNTANQLLLPPLLILINYLIVQVLGYISRLDDPTLSR
jgi:hypothetical protein